MDKSLLIKLFLCSFLVLPTCCKKAETDKTNVVELTENKIIVIEYQGTFAAIKLLKHGNDFAKVKWWIQEKPSQDFISGNVKTGFVDLFEKYERVKTIEPNTFQVKDKGSNLFIKLNNLEIEWSASNWLYINENYNYEIFDTNDISEVKINSP